MPFTMLFAKDGILPYARLHVLIHIGIGEAKQQTVCPGLVDHADLSDDRLIVISIVETLHSLGLLAVETAGLEILHRRVHPIVVVRIVLESVDLVCETIRQCLSEIDVRLMRVERSIRVGGVEEPTVLIARATALLGDDVDHATDGVRPETNRNNSLVDLDPLREIDRDIIQPERTADALLRHAIDENLDMLATEAIQ